MSRWSRWSRSAADMAAIDPGPKRDGYLSSGVDRNESVGESSNLRFGDVWVAQESIVAIWGNYRGGLVCCLIGWCDAAFREEQCCEQDGDRLECRPFLQY